MTEETSVVNLNIVNQKQLRELVAPVADLLTDAVQKASATASSMVILTALGEVAGAHIQMTAEEMVETNPEHKEKVMKELLLKYLDECAYGEAFGTFVFVGDRPNNVTPMKPEETDK